MHNIVYLLSLRYNVIRELPPILAQHNRHRKANAMNKFIITAVAVTALAVPALASADAPDGTYRAEGQRTPRNASSIGKLSSQITQNGQHVSGNGLVAVRPDDVSRLPCRAVQAALGH